MQRKSAHSVLAISFEQTPHRPESSGTLVNAQSGRKEHSHQQVEAYIIKERKGVTGIDGTEWQLACQLQPAAIVMPHEPENPQSSARQSITPSEQMLGGPLGDIW